MIKLGDRVLLAPLLGSIDDRVLLAPLLGSILDVTGVSRIDASTAAHLIRLVHAVRLLGAEAILAGLPPAVATAMVSLGIDLRRVATARDLQAALARCVQTPGR